MDNDLIVRLRRGQELKEMSFRSDVPVIGGLIARFRRLWNSVSTRWYVLSLVQQQNEFNAELVQTLEIHLERLDQRLIELDERLVDLDRDQVALAHDLAEVQYRLVQLSRGNSGESELDGDGSSSTRDEV